MPGALYGGKYLLESPRADVQRGGGSFLGR
jgi:hypothetical protein